MRKFSGIDLHSNNSVVEVSDETDQIVYQRRHANNLGEILRALEPYRGELVGVVVESTYNWYWLVEQGQIAALEERLGGARKGERRFCAVEVGTWYR